MHELSICQALIEQVEIIARKEKASQVQVIHLGVGPLSGVEPRLLEHAFFIAKAGTVADDAQLIITSQPVRVSCNECGELTNALPNRLVCGHCGDWRTKLVSGDELHLRRIELVKPATRGTAEPGVAPLSEQELFG